MRKATTITMILFAATLASAARPRKKPKPAPAPTPAAEPAPAPVAEPAPAPAAASQPVAPKKEEAAPDVASEVQALRKEYEGVRDELFRSRAKAAAVGSALYSSRLELGARHVAARFRSLRRMAIRLDGASVFEDATGAPMTDDAIRFQGWVAPGPHQITFHVEAQAKDDERFVSTVEDTMTIDVPAGTTVTVKARVDDDGDIAYEWKKSQKGSYKLKMDVSVEARRLPRPKNAAPAAGTSK